MDKHTEAHLAHERWGSLIKATPQEKVVVAETLLHVYKTNAKPILAACSDGNDYVVKGHHIGRGVINEHVTGRLASVINAPVPDVAIVSITEEFVEVNDGMSYFSAGRSHGKRYIPDCIDREQFTYTDVDENRSRFARLAVLYGWVPSTGDLQLIYKKHAPQLIYSFDHERFFPHGPQWTMQCLTHEPLAKVNMGVQFDCQLTTSEIHEAICQLGHATDEVIAGIVGGIPSQWVISEYERIHLAMYLARRRDELTNSFQNCS